MPVAVLAHLAALGENLAIARKRADQENHRA